MYKRKCINVSSSVAIYQLSIPTHCKNEPNKTEITQTFNTHFHKYTLGLKNIKYIFKNLYPLLSPPQHYFLDLD